MELLAAHLGTWAGENGFRMMPGDPVHEVPATAEISTGARGKLTTIAYTWSHPEDGPQEGYLVMGSDEDPPAALAFWSDSWHQTPAAKVLAGEVKGNSVSLGYDYAGDWRWIITVEAPGPEVLDLRMENVVPASVAPEAAGPYTAMYARFRRS